MTAPRDDGGPIFPAAGAYVHSPFQHGPVFQPPAPGMSLRYWFAGQALSNPAICDGHAEQWEIKRWFGPERTGVERAEIVAKQAWEYADAMLAARNSQKEGA